jgi:hypothetical protein
MSAEGNKSNIFDLILRRVDRSSLASAARRFSRYRQRAVLWKYMGRSLADDAERVSAAAVDRGNNRLRSNLKSNNYSCSLPSLEAELTARSRPSRPRVGFYFRPASRTPWRSAEPTTIRGLSMTGFLLIKSWRSSTALICNPSIAASWSWLTIDQ